MGEDVPAPAIFSRLPGVPNSLLGTLHALDELDGVAPRQSCNNLLHDFALRKRLRESPSYILDFEGKSGHLRCRVPSWNENMKSGTDKLAGVLGRLEQRRCRLEHPR